MKILITSFVIIGFVSLQARGETIVFPEDELATESVYPKFDVPNNVRSRNVKVDGKFEIGAFGGWATDEPIYNPMQMGLLGTYHFDEFHGMNVTYASFMPGLTSNAAQIKDVPTLGYDYSKTFGPKSYYLLQYQFTGYYGKMSLGKSVTVNLHLYGLAGLGMMNFDGKSEICYDLGIGQRFYFTRNMALRFDMRFMRYNGPNPASIQSRAALNSGNLKVNDFATTSFLTTHLTVGLVWLM